MLAHLSINTMASFRSNGNNGQTIPTLKSETGLDNWDHTLQLYVEYQDSKEHLDNHEVKPVQDDDESIKDYADYKRE